MTKKGNIWVSPRGDRWAVQREGSERASLLTPTKHEAVEAGRELAKQHGAELIVQGRDGRIQSRDSYGSDPFPPRDTEH